MPKLIHQKTGKVVAEKILTATKITDRLRGLMCRSSFPALHAFWILPCKGGIHTFFMYFPIDIIFVTKNLKITRVIEHITAMKIIFPPLFTKTYSVFEFKTPSLQHHELQLGDQLYVDH